jgi:hypothetical protein
MKRGSGIKDREDRSSGIEIPTAEAYLMMMMMMMRVLFIMKR